MVMITIIKRVNFMVKGWQRTRFMVVWRGKWVLSEPVRPIPVNLGVSANFCSPSLKNKILCYCSGMDNCNFENCYRPMLVRKWGLCSGHYDQHRRGIPLRPLKRSLRGERCCVEGCVREAWILRYLLCKEHYDETRRRGDKMNLATCAIPDCTKLFRARGLCAGHTSVVDVYSLTPEEVVNLFTNPSCSICGVKGLKLAVDHDHDCCAGKSSCGACVRGLVCTSCNNKVSQEERRRKDPVHSGVVQYVSTNPRFRK